MRKRFDSLTERAKDRLARIAAAFLILSAGIVYIYPSITITSSMYDYSSKLGEIERLSERLDRLNLEIAAVGSTEYIERVAIEELGMVYPEPSAVVFIARRRAAGQAVSDR